MQRPKKKIFVHIINIVTVVLIIECFLCAILAVRLYAKNDCINRIKETTEQMSHMMNSAMDENMKKLEVFAGILADNASNPDELLKTYMEGFCQTQYFSAICVHRKLDGSVVSFGDVPEHEHIVVTDEFKPYTSEVIGEADKRCFYHAVPIVRNGETVGVLHGYITLDKLPEFITSAAYGGKCVFYLVDAKSGRFLMNGHNKVLDSIDDIRTDMSEVRRGYSLNEMLDDIEKGRSGDFCFRSSDDGKWYYIYYMPLGINNWSMQLTVEESVASENYDDISGSIIILSICVILLMLIHVFALMLQTAHIKKGDRKRLTKTKYMYEVQRALFNAHNNPNYIEQALKSVADEMTAETVILLTFSDRTVSNSYYWPSKDRNQALDLLGRNIREDFPTIFDMLSANKNVVYYPDSPSIEISERAKQIFEKLEVYNVMLVPIVDNAGFLKGTICSVNMADKKKDCEMLECVTYDFFMAITNIENHTIIKNMGSMDYLTNIKNRNSYEAELIKLSAFDAKKLWCVFIDVNGLHEINNEQGHKAGDRMLCAVADAVKKVFGRNYTYRVGGDEFVAFSFNDTKEELLSKKKSVVAALSEKGYSVSIGFEGDERKEGELFDVERIVSKAETIMYSEKQKWYAENNISSGRTYLQNKDKK